MKVSNIIKVLAIIWFAETLIACLLYLAVDVFSPHINIRPILLLKIYHFIFYYWFLFLIYFFRVKPCTVMSFCLINSIVFIFISSVISFILKDMSDLFFEYTFVCNLLGIILAPYLLKKINTKLPGHLRVY